MQRVEKDITPAEEWKQSLNATCNKLSTQYLNLLKAGTNSTYYGDGAGGAGVGGGNHNTSNSSSGAGAATTPNSNNTTTNNGNCDPRVGGGRMRPDDPPPPPLAADVALSTLQASLAAENICVGASNLLSLIRTLRLSLLLMDEDTISAEEELEVQRTRDLTQSAVSRGAELEHEYRVLQSQSLTGTATADTTTPHEC